MKTTTKKPGRPKRHRSRTGITVDLGVVDPRTGSTSRMFWRDELEMIFDVGRSTFTKWLSNLISNSDEFRENWIPNSERFSELHFYYLQQYKILNEEYSGGQLRRAIANIPRCKKKKVGNEKD